MNAQKRSYAMRYAIGFILACAAGIGFIFSILAVGGPNVQHITDHPTGWWGVLPYGVFVCGFAAYFLIKDAFDGEFPE